MTRKEEVKKRIAELEARIATPGRLEPEEYLEHLYEIQKNATLRMEIQTVDNNPKGVGAWLNLTDRIHFLIDSVNPQPKTPDEPKTIILKFEPDGPDDDPVQKPIQPSEAP